MSRRNEQGFTLPELLIVMIVTAILSGVILGFFVNQIRAIVIASAKQDLLEQAQIGLDYTAQDVRVSANADDSNRWPDATMIRSRTPSAATCKPSLRM